MSRDISLLCNAVEIVCDHLGILTSTEDQEAIVFGVLTALREPSEDCLHAGGLEAAHHQYRAMGSADMRREVARDTLGVMINYILASKA